MTDTDGNEATHGAPQLARLRKEADGVAPLALVSGVGR